MSKASHIPNWTRRAKRLWPNAVWIDGDGPIALLAHCRALTVTLYKNRPSAQAAMARLRRGGCGGQCHDDHELVEMVKTYEDLL